MGWASSWKQRIRFTPLHLALLGADAIARWRPQPWPVQPDRNWRPGISVLVPERGTPDLLAQCLQAALTALAQLDEPSELLVVVNGAPEADYSELRARHPQVRWQFHAQALGYNGAIAAGLAAIEHDWVYLLNSDMIVVEDALSALLPYRQAEVFAITSQIHFVDQQRRREETGWSDFRVHGADVIMYEREPEASPLARGNLYPGGGSSLCRSGVLRRYAADSACYSPFYYEDAEWGARAWSEGWEVLFCPSSHAQHHHRGTVGRHYDAAEVERVISRNAQLFELRHGWTELTPERAMRKTCDNDYRTQQELYSPTLAHSVYSERLRSRRAQARGLDLARITRDHYYPRPRPTTGKPRVLLVTPFALFPPAHGGARRIAELSTRLADQVDLILLSDERSLYGVESEPWFGAFRAVHLVEGRGDQAGEAILPWPARLKRHAHPRLRAELARLLAVYQPDIVQLEFMELAGLRARQKTGARWVLAMHDVYLDGGGDDALQKRLMADFDALTVCSGEDAALLDHPNVALVANGGQDRRDDAPPSPEQPNLLFMGPFRYAPNAIGIRAFVEQGWQAIRAAHPQATLTILGGPDATSMGREAWLQAPGIELIDRFVDPAPHLARASLTINPQLTIRGSALKLIESLLAARVCVSTGDGARGFQQAQLAGLRIVPDIASMAAEINTLLADHNRRRQLERADAAALQTWTWNGIAAEQLALYRRLIGASA